MMLLLQEWWASLLRCAQIPWWRTRYSSYNPIKEVFASCINSWELWVSGMLSEVGFCVAIGWVDFSQCYFKGGLAPAEQFLMVAWTCRNLGITQTGTWMSRVVQGCVQNLPEKWDCYACCCDSYSCPQLSSWGRSTNKGDLGKHPMPLQDFPSSCTSQMSRSQSHQSGRSQQGFPTANIHPCICTWGFGDSLNLQLHWAPLCFYCGLSPIQLSGCRGAPPFGTGTRHA